MALNLRTAVRRTAFAAAVGGTALLAMCPAAAQQVQKAAGTQPAITANTDCSTYKPGVLMADTECEIRKGQFLDNQLDKATDTLGCMQKIRRFFDQGKVSRETIMQYGKERACDLARTLG